MTSTLDQSFTYCQQLTRRQAGNFYPAFRVLPRAQRLAMCALYAFMRIADDIGDEPALAADKRQRLTDWRRGLEGALTGQYDHPAHEALHHTVNTYGIPAQYLLDVLDGVEMDLGTVAFTTFDQLRVYCYRVASAVGLACIHIWGYSDERAKVYAEQAGLAFQLTNILRDLGEDAARDRIYLPQEELDRFGYDAERLRRGQRDEAFAALMRFQVARARAYYDAAWPLVPLLGRPGRAVFLAMAGIYRELLAVMERHDYDVFSSRLGVSRRRKLILALKALPVRWGWTG